ncbi:pregnancy-specific beta-1-glycoprotein 5 [Alligator mississippiensis]|uniref:pregnancy-specific beta-1-glycoprotein 5 n=1 Tax=Alligator mississippiensis TaxID=8496 RepID=UPI0006ECC9E4|nr:pregnancy-specific beta-1-glycoprotein 5 [Alligator mississippiensis]
MVQGVGQVDAGYYTCEVRNPDNTVRSEAVIVTVIYGLDTVHIDPPGPLFLPLGDRVTLTCVADSLPVPWFHWSQNSSILVLAPTGAILSLVLAGMEQTGMFKCCSTSPKTSHSTTGYISIALGLGQEGLAIRGGPCGAARSVPPVYENEPPSPSGGSDAAAQDLYQELWT